MNALRRRLAELDKRFREVRPREPVFISYIGDPWTPEQAAAAIRRYPNAVRFWRPLVPGKYTDPVTRCDVWPSADSKE